MGQRCFGIMLGAKLPAKLNYDDIGPLSGEYMGVVHSMADNPAFNLCEDLDAVLVGFWIAMGGSGYGRDGEVPDLHTVNLNAQRPPEYERAWKRAWKRWQKWRAWLEKTHPKIAKQIGEPGFWLADTETA